MVHKCFLIALWSWMQYSPLGGSNTFFSLLFCTTAEEHRADSVLQQSLQTVWPVRSMEQGDHSHSVILSQYIVGWLQHYTWRNIKHQAQWNLKTFGKNNNKNTCTQPKYSRPMLCFPWPWKVSRWTSVSLHSSTTWLQTTQSHMNLSLYCFSVKEDFGYVPSQRGITWTDTVPVWEQLPSRTALTTRQTTDTAFVLSHNPFTSIENHW